MTPIAANAQTCTTEDCATTAAAGLVSTTTVIIIVVAAAAIAGIVFGIISTVNNANRAAAPRAAELYLRENSLQLAQDMAAGSGPMLTDLAAAMELHKANVPTFARLMSKNRAALLSLADRSKLTPERAAAFFRNMTQLMAADPQIAPDYQQFLTHQASLPSHNS